MVKLYLYEYRICITLDSPTAKERETVRLEIVMGIKTFRLRDMEQYILEHDTVSMEELKTRFKISMNTTRLDVAELVSKGTIRKVYGGVCSNHKNSLIPFDEREAKNKQSKMAVGREAATLVEEGDIIYIDSGTTTMYIMDYLGEKKNVTVLTNNLNAINKALAFPNLTVISLPGALERKTNSFVSADTVRIMEKYNINKAFMASSGLSEAGTITTSSPLEFEIKKSAMLNSQKHYLLIDSSKYGKSALLTFATVSDMTKIIIDSVPNGMEDLCKRADTKILIGKIN